MSRLLLLVFVCGVMTCQKADPHIIAERSPVSRDYKYISFERTREPFHFKGSAGGEYMAVTKVLAFVNQKYRVELTPKNDNLKLYVNGIGVQTESLDEFTKTVTVDGQLDDGRPETMFEIAITSYPEAVDFTLTVTPLWTSK